MRFQTRSWKFLAWLVRRLDTPVIDLYYYQLLLVCCSSCVPVSPRALTFGYKRARPAEGRVLAGSGVTAQQWLRFVGKESLGALHGGLLHHHTGRL